MSKSMMLLRLAMVLGTSIGFTSADFGAVLAYEGIDYDDVEAELNGKNGGVGWSGPWERFAAGLEEAAVFDVADDGQSLSSPIFPSTTTGSRVITRGPVAGQASDGGSNEVRIHRPLATPFDLTQQGNALYASYLFQKDITGGGTPANNLEINLETGGGLNNRVRFGSTSGDQFFLNNTDTVSQLEGIPLTLSQTYFIVLKVEADPTAGDHPTSVLIFDPSRAVPTEEPVSWDATRTFANPTSNQIINVGLWIGRRAGGLFDEIRLGETWADVTTAAPPPPLHPGDFDGDGDVDGADFVAWQTNFPKAADATLAEGDADGDGDVDGADFVVWQTNFPFTPSPAVSTIPEPAGIVLGTLGAAALLTFGTQSRRRKLCYELL